MSRNLRSNLNKNLFAGTGMPQTQTEKDNLWDTSEDKFWERKEQYVKVNLPSDSLLKDKDRLAKLSGEVKVFHISSLEENKNE